MTQVSLCGQAPNTRAQNFPVNPWVGAHTPSQGLKPCSCTQPAWQGRRAREGRVRGLLHLSPCQENICFGSKFPFKNVLGFEGNIFLNHFLRGNHSAISERKIFLLLSAVCHFDSWRRYAREVSQVIASCLCKLAFCAYAHVCTSVHMLMGTHWDHMHMWASACILLNLQVCVCIQCTLACVCICTCVVIHRNTSQRGKKAKQRMLS